MKQIVYSSDYLFSKPIGISNGSLTLIECDNSKADEVIKKYHYSHKATKNRFKSFEVNSGKGYLQLGYGIRPTMKHTISKAITKDNYCEFDSMWLSDDLAKNSESQVIGLLLSYLKSIYSKIKFVITYADESAGNMGIIYKATNAIQLGSIPCDFYILPSGERIHPVSMYHRHGTRAQGTLNRLYPGIKHIKGQFRQFRFLYVLSKKYAKEVSREIRSSISR